MTNNTNNIDTQKNTETNKKKGSFAGVATFLSKINKKIVTPLTTVLEHGPNKKESKAAAKADKGAKIVATPTRWSTVRSTVKCEYFVFLLLTFNTLFVYFVRV
jgi:hypothetical protein